MQTEEWIDWFDQAFGEISNQEGWSPLLAKGCREGWLQGELHRQFPEDHFWVNTTQIGYRQTVDFAWFQKGAPKDQPSMIAELKIIMNDAFDTGLSGRRNLDEIEATYIRSNKKVDADFLTDTIKRPAKDCVMRDIHRLYKAKKFGDIDKFIIVVLPKYLEDKDSQLLDIAKQIDFDMAENSPFEKIYSLPSEMAEFMVRIWKIKN